MHGVRPSAWHDPDFAAAARRASAAGVQFRAVSASVGLDGTRLTHELAVDLSEAIESKETMESTAREVEAARETTGWTRSASGVRVGNGPFPHHVTAAKQAAKAEKAEAAAAAKVEKEAAKAATKRQKKS